MTEGAPIVVAIDGPAGAGKSTVAKAVAERLGLVRLDTGSMYRAVAWAARRRGIDPADREAVARLAGGLDLRFDEAGIVVEGTSREREIRDPDVTATVSAVSSNQEVRRALVARQRALAEAGGAVIEGRDIGTVVAPRAQVKVFLTASPDERARRRGRDLEAAGHPVDPGELRRALDERDVLDHRTTPLEPAPGAVVIDSTGKTIDEVVDEIASLARGAGWEPR